MSRQCSNCAFWKAYNQSLGQCCRRPPLIIEGLITDKDVERNRDDKIHYATRFPETDREDWCGDWEELENIGASRGPYVELGTPFKDSIPRDHGLPPIEIKLTQGGDAC